MRRTRRTGADVAAIGALAVAALAAGVGGASAQVAGSGWLPWLGCWVEAEAPAEAPMTCVVPEDGGVAVLTVSRTGVTARDLLRTDGAEYAVEAAGCSGVQAAEPSRDGTRLYTRSRLECEGGSERVTRGLIAMVSPDEWIRVRAMTVGEGSASWVERYRPAPASRVEAAALPELEGVDDRAMAVETARMAAAAGLTVDDIIEAHQRTEPEAVRAWIAARGEEIRLDADGLVRLADAGVREEVIDLAIAVSFPQHFQVEQRVAERAAERWDRFGQGRYGQARYGRYGGFWPGYYDPFFYNDIYFFGSRGYPYGYGSRGWYGYGYPTTLIVRTAEEVRRQPGQLVEGSGYSPRSPASGRATPASTGPSRGLIIRGTGARAGSTAPSKGKAKAKPKSGGG